VLGDMMKSTIQENHKFCDDIVNNEGMDHFNDDDMYDITHNFSYIHHYCIIHIYNIFRGKKMGYLLNKIMNGKLSNELHPFNKDIFECIELSISSSISSLVISVSSDIIPLMKSL